VRGAELDELSDIFPGTSVMAEAMREKDWSTTSLGDPLNWPESLKIPLRMLLTSRFEMWLGWGPDLNFFYNDAYIPTLGMKHPSMLGRPFRKVWAEVYDDVADQVAKVRAGEATWNKALLLLLERSGYPEETYHTFSYSPLFGGDGGVDGLLCIVTEETARVVSERRLETLRDLGEKLSATHDRSEVQAVAHGVLQKNAKDFPFAAMVLADEVSASLLVEAVRQAIGMASGNFGPPDGLVELMGGFDWPAGSWETAPARALVLPVVEPGEQSPSATLYLGLNPHRPADADLENFARLVADQIGGALANVAALGNERRRADRIWSISRDLIVVVDQSGVFRSVSPSWTRILGQRAEDVVGRSFADFMHPDDIAPSGQALSKALEEGDLDNYENRFVDVDGNYHSIQWHTTMEDGLVYAYGRDVTDTNHTQTELAAAREALFQSQKMEAIGQLTGGVAHDFNNLLMAVMSSLDLLRKRLPPDDASLRLVDNALEGAKRGATLTQRMLSFARRQQLELATVDVPRPLSNMNDLVQRSIGPEWPISTSFPLRLPPVRADANQLEMAILNLIVNARDAMQSGGSIVISATSENVGDSSRSIVGAGKYVRLVVTDTGSGMDAETVRRAIEPFFTTKGVGKGTGLGLPMVQGMAQQLGGAFEMNSSVGVGTSAILWLPVADDVVEVESGPRQVEPAPAANKLTVLVVDDDALVLMNTTALLEDLGHTVVEAVSGAEALDLFKSRPDFDLVVTDQAMPRMTGSQLVSALDEARPGIPVVVASGYGDGVNIPRRDVVLLGKPFDQARLAESIAKAMSARPA